MVGIRTCVFKRIAFSFSFDYLTFSSQITLKLFFVLSYGHTTHALSIEMIHNWRWVDNMLDNKVHCYRWPCVAEIFSAFSASHQFRIRAIARSTFSVLCTSYRV